MFEAATFTNGAIQTPPTLLQDDLGDPDIDAMRMVTFAALRTSDQTAFEVGANGSAHDANVLFKHKIVIDGDADHLGIFFWIVFGTWVSLRPLEADHASHFGLTSTSSHFNASLLVHD